MLALSRFSPLTALALIAASSCAAASGGAVSGTPTWLLLLLALLTLLGGSTVGGVATWFLSRSQRAASVALAVAQTDETHGEADERRIDTATKQFALLDRYLTELTRTREALEKAMTLTVELRTTITAQAGEILALTARQSSTEQQLQLANDKIAVLQGESEAAQRLADTRGAQLAAAGERIAVLEEQVRQLKAENARLKGTA